MMIQNGWLNVFENFQLLWCQDLLIKYAVADSWSISFQQCPKSVFRGEHGVRGHDNGHNDAQRVFRRNQQLMPSIPKSYVWSITNTLNIIRMLFFQLVRVVIIIYKKYISVIQNISSKTLEQCNDYFCINKCLVQQLHCLLIVSRCAFDTKILKTINYENHCILKQTWPKFENMIIFTHFIHFSYLGTKFRNFALNLGHIRQIRSKLIKMLVRRIYSVKVFWEVSLVIAFAHSKYGTNKFLDMTFEKVWEKASMIIVSKIYFAFLLVALPMILRSIFGWSSRNMFNKNSSSILKSISMR